MRSTMVIATIGDTMKKILEKLCSVRVILTVLCLLSFAMEAWADYISSPVYPSAVDIIQLLLKNEIIITVIVIFSAVFLGYWLVSRFEKLRCVVRFIQVILFGSFFLMWGCTLLKGNALDFREIVCLLAWMAAMIFACLFSGVWTNRKITSEPALCGVLGFFVLFILFAACGWEYVFHNGPAASTGFFHLLILSVLAITASLIPVFRFRFCRKNIADPDPHPAKNSKIHKWFILSAVGLLIGLAIILCIKFAYLSFYKQPEKKPVTEDFPTKRFPSHQPENSVYYNYPNKHNSSPGKQEWDIHENHK